MLALIDCDILIYSISSAAEKTYYEVCIGGQFVGLRQGKKKTKNLLEKYNLKEEDCKITKYPWIGKFDQCVWSFKALLKYILQNSGATDYELVISGDRNFRKEKYPDYKVHRKEEKPIYFYRLKKWIIDSYEVVITENGYEADDYLGGYQGGFSLEKSPTLDTIICSIDKDLDMIPGWHYNWRHDIKYNVTQKEAKEWFYKQMLMGDSADNIKGLFKVGPIRAENILKALGENKLMEIKEFYEEEFKDNGKTFEKNYTLLKIHGAMVPEIKEI